MLNLLFNKLRLRKKSFNHLLYKIRLLSYQLQNNEQ